MFKSNNVRKCRNNCCWMTISSGGQRGLG